VPEFISLSRTLTKLREELAGEADRTRRKTIMTEMSLMEARIAIARKGWTGSR
jgi:hypothetical protein